jgi:type I restriction enzyme M protein
MRRSLGNKRNVISDNQIAEITAIYSGFEDGLYSKIFDNVDFGYRRITVERPLRLNYRVDRERIENLVHSPVFLRAVGSKRAKGQQLSLDIESPDGQASHPALTVLSSMDDTLYRDRSSFERALTRAFDTARVPLPAPLRTAIVNGLAERDEAAEAIAGKNGRPEPDTDLRDTENVPLKEDVHAYFAREVLPHVSEAWISEAVRDEKDGEIGKVGYEIPFTRYFYEYKRPRPLEEIDGNIKELEAEILMLLQQVTT